MTNNEEMISRLLGQIKHFAPYASAEAGPKGEASIEAFAQQPPEEQLWTAAALSHTALTACALVLHRQNELQGRIEQLTQAVAALPERLLELIASMEEEEEPPAEVPAPADNIVEMPKKSKK